MQWVRKLIDYWHDVLTEKSWNILKNIKNKFNFTLIGGWAVYLYSKTHKSKDIDIIVDFKTLEKLKKQYDLRKNDKLKKYEIKIEEIDIDIYVPFYSNLSIPLQDLKTTKIEGFNVISIEYLLILKQDVEQKRSFSVKGEKDRIDTISLLFNCDVNFKEYINLLKKYKIEYLLKNLINLVNNFKEYKYLDLTPRQFKLKKKEILENLKRI